MAQRGYTLSKILIVEDDIDLAQLIARWSSKAGHEAMVVETVSEGISHLKHYHVDLIILDRQLPDGDGLDILREIRALRKGTAILMLTGKIDIKDRVYGLESGADDYLCKPFDARELMARIAASLRRPAGYNPETIIWGRLVLDSAKKRVYCDGKEVSMQPREFSLLEHFLKNIGRKFSADTLLNMIWSDTEAPSREAVTTCVKRIRKKLAILGDIPTIKNVHGYGYGIDDWNDPFEGH